MEIAKDFGVHWAMDFARTILTGCPLENSRFGK
jgi:hypothetical protein